MHDPFECRMIHTPQPRTKMPQEGKRKRVNPEKNQKCVSSAKTSSESQRKAVYSDPADLQALRSFLGEDVTPPPSVTAIPSRKKRRKALDKPHQAAAQLPPGQPERPVTALKKKPKEPEHVEGVFQGDELYLKDTSTGHVYSSKRNRQGDLVPVGVWDDVSKAILFKPPSATIEEQITAPVLLGRPPSLEPTTRVRAVMPEALAFAADADDHCETAPEAYEHIKPLLNQLCALLGKGPADLQIYDPYFCAGSVVRNLAQLGFPNVYNKNEDFYRTIEDGTVPEHDVLITNPPYSEDHMERLFSFCSKHTKPWFLLIPHYVHSKPYYSATLAKGFDGRHVKPFYLVPKKRYHYWSPKGAHRSNPSIRKDGRTSPFVTFWHVHAGPHNVALLKWWHKKGFKKCPRVRVFNNVSSLPDFAIDTEGVPRKAKDNHKHR